MWEKCGRTTETQLAAQKTKETIKIAQKRVCVQCVYVLLSEMCAFDLTLCLFGCVFMSPV